MKTDTHFWSYLAQFFLEWEMFQTTFVEQIKTHILCSVTFCRKSHRLWDNVGKYGRAGQATDDNIIRRMRIACWLIKATNTNSKYNTSGFCIWKVLGSKLDQGTSYLEWSLTFFSVPIGESLKTNNNSFLPHSLLFIIHQSPQNVTLCNMSYSEVRQSTRKIDTENQCD